MPPRSRRRARFKAILKTLHHADLALSCACSAGSEAAWEFFVAQFRQELYRAGRAITGSASAGDADARELADSLYADLYGLRESEGRRKSLFDYFHGRSKLGTWLRAILAQRHVDAIRRARKFEPLEDETGRERSEITERAAASRQPGRARHARRSAIRPIRIARDTSACCKRLLLPRSPHSSRATACGSPITTPMNGHSPKWGSCSASTRRLRRASSNGRAAASANARTRNYAKASSSARRKCSSATNMRARSGRSI